MGGHGRELRSDRGARPVRLDVVSLAVPLQRRKPHPVPLASQPRSCAPRGSSVVFPRRRAPSRARRGPDGDQAEGMSANVRACPDVAGAPTQAPRQAIGRARTVSALELGNVGPERSVESSSVAAVAVTALARNDRASLRQVRRPREPQADPRGPQANARMLWSRATPALHLGATGPGTRWPKSPPLCANGDSLTISTGAGFAAWGVPCVLTPGGVRS